MEFIKKLQEKYTEALMNKSYLEFKQKYPGEFPDFSDFESPATKHFIAIYNMKQIEYSFEYFYMNQPQITELAATVTTARGPCRLLYELYIHEELQPHFRTYECSDRYNEKNENDKLQLKTDITFAKTILDDFLRLEIVQRVEGVIMLSDAGKNYFVESLLDSIEKNAALSHWRPRRPEKKGDSNHDGNYQSR